MAASHMGLASSDGHDATHGTNMGRAHVNIRIVLMHHVCQLVQKRVMATNDHKSVV